MSSLASDQLDAEQSWVTGHLKTARNEADKQSGTMQGFLTDSLLAWLVQVDVSLRDQANSLELLQQGLLAGLAGMQTERQEFLHHQKKLLLTANSRVQALSRQQVVQLVAMVENEEKVREPEIQFGARFQVHQILKTTQKITSLPRKQSGRLTGCWSLCCRSTSSTLV